MKDDGRGIPVEDNLSRISRSLWLVILSLVVSLAWAGSYFFAPEDMAFLGTPLSSEHDHLKDDCGACHRQGRGVPQSLCATAECHQAAVLNNLHEDLPDRCISCHPEHWPGEPIPKGMTDQECSACHEAIWEQEGRPEQSMVGREIFSHAPHRKNYDCRTCHVRGEGTLDVPREKLFKMDTCTICHEEGQCQVCHSYHDKKAKPRKQAGVPETVPAGTEQNTTAGPAQVE